MFYVLLLHDRMLFYRVFWTLCLSVKYMLKAIWTQHKAFTSQSQIAAEIEMWFPMLQLSKGYVLPKKTCLH